MVASECYSCALRDTLIRSREARASNYGFYQSHLFFGGEKKLPKRVTINVSLIKNPTSTLSPQLPEKQKRERK
ncbi:hypothetical protein RJT34_33451 [Clitoria ternatea]|uniref:Uncharacterized protein n=1 Tax=Clitoria ternatea TaxID=43366 RepID=A0AAN9EY76_CLITE